MRHINLSKGTRMREAEWGDRFSCSFFSRHEQSKLEHLINIKEKKTKKKLNRKRNGISKQKQELTNDGMDQNIFRPHFHRSKFYSIILRFFFLDLNCWQIHDTKNGIKREGKNKNTSCCQIWCGWERKRKRILLKLEMMLLTSTHKT